MLSKLKESLYGAVIEGLKCATENAKEQYPKIKSSAEKTAEKTVEKINDEAIPALNKAADNVSKFVMDKYSEAINSAKKQEIQEQEEKKQKMSSFKKAIIGTTLGFAAGAVTGYVMVKKNEIKESDYVFSDEGDFSQAYNPSSVNPVAVQNAVSAANSVTSNANSFNSFNNNNAFNNDINVGVPRNNAYQMAQDGTFIRSNL